MRDNLIIKRLKCEGLFSSKIKNMTEEETKNILNKAFEKMAFPAGNREQALRNILRSVYVGGNMKLRLGLPEILALVAAAVIIAVIVYGIWLPSDILTEFS
jgi:hypothetical protein